MKLFRYAFLLIHTEYLFLRVTACSGDHHHHHRSHGSLRHRDLEEVQLDDDFEFPSCGMEDSSTEQRRQESKAMASWKVQHRGRNLAETSYTIPVYFHILRDTRGNGDLTDGMLYAYVQSLNQEYAGTPFSFQMIRVNRVNNSDWHKCTFSNNREAKKALNVSGRHNLNVYFCDIQNGSGGWAYMPYNAGDDQYDGVVIESNYDKLGFPKGYVRKTVLPHEVGHWLGLYHTHQDGCNAEYKENGAWNDDFAYFNGDGVHDTPAHVEGYKDCDKSYNTCSDDTPGVDPGPDPLSNIMSYAYDRCTDSFTAGQQERMVAMYEFYRYDPDAPAPELPTPPPKTYCDEDKCTGMVARFLGMTHRVRTAKDGRCRSRCVRQKTAERLMKRGSHVCGRCPGQKQLFPFF